MVLRILDKLKNDRCKSTSNFYSDLIDNNKIIPSDFLVKEDVEKIEEAIELTKEFKDLIQYYDFVEDSDLIQYSDLIEGSNEENSDKRKSLKFLVKEDAEKVEKSMKLIKEFKDLTKSLIK